MQHPTVILPLAAALPVASEPKKDRQRRRSAKSEAVQQVASDNDLGRPIVEEDAQRIATQSKNTRDVRRARKRGAVEPV